MRPIRHIAIDFDTAVHRTRMHDQQVVVGGFEPSARNTEDPIVFPDTGHEPRVHSLVLEAEHIERVCPLDRGLDAPKASNAQVLHTGRNQSRGSADGDLGAHGTQTEDVGPRHTGVEDVTHDADLDALQAAEMVPAG